MALIADTASTNKQTIYAYFNDKTKLFNTVLTRRHTNIFTNVDGATHIDLYDVDEYVLQAANRLAQFFTRFL